MVTINIHKKDLYLLSAIFVFLIGVAYVVAYGSSNPAIMGHDAGEIDSYCYTYYSTSLSSCVCPSGETNKKDLGLWGVCDGHSGGGNRYRIFRPPGPSCADVWPVSGHDHGYSNSFDQGLACVCCEQ